MLGRQICLLTFENSKSSGPISTPVLLLSNQETTPPEEIIFLNEKRKANHTGTATHFGQIILASLLHIMEKSEAARHIQASFELLFSFTR